MKKLMVFMLAFAALACAADEPQKVQKIVPVKNGDVNQIFQTVRDIMQGQLNVRMYQNNVVLNGSTEAVAAGEQLIKNLEISAPREHDIDVTGYIVLASTQPAEGGGAIPADLEPVLKQFRNLSSYKSFRVLDTILVRAKENSEASTEGFLALPNVPAPASTQFHIARAAITDDVVHLKGLVLHASVPAATGKGSEFTNRSVTLATDADVKAGQKVAIGKASVNVNGDALILVISANVVN